MRRPKPPVTPLERTKSALNHLEKWAYLHGLRPTPRMPLPDFLGIGAQKSGTSWLDANLRHHPDVYLPPRKELHYWDRQYDRSLRSYSRKFRGAGSRLKGEITPFYSILPVERIRMIHAIRPDTKLIFLMRNPVERAWSHALMRLVKRRNRRFEDVSEQEFLEQFRHRGSLRLGDYPRILASWLSVFPEEQLFVGFFEDVKERPRELLTGVMEHLGLRTDIDWDSMPYHEVVHGGVKVRMPEKYRKVLQEMYQRDLEALHERFGAPVSRWMTPKS
ncbi:MAG: sulfotransferase family protein [Armatimonadota bacterium]